MYPMPTRRVLPMQRGYTDYLKAQRAAKAAQTFQGNAPDLTNRYMQAVSQAGAGVGNPTEQAATGRMLKFNPGAAVTQYATGAFNALKPELARSVGELRGQQVGMGRFDSGFATEDEDRLVGQAYKGLTDQISQQALGAAGLAERNNEALAGVGSDMQNRYLDLISGGLDRATAEKNAEQQRKKGLFGTIGSVLGGIGGFAFGGPIGAQAGARIGGTLGGVAG